MTHSLLRTLSGYVPGLLRRRIQHDPRPIAQPTIDRYEAVVLFADISGFTELTENLAARGPEGVEVLTEHLNKTFGQLITAIEARGGDVFKFAGDALTAIWTVGDAERTLNEAAHQAAACALEIQRAIRGERTPLGGRLSLKIGLSAGRVYSTHLGGELKRWEYFLTGEPMVMAGKAESTARPGQIILAPEFRQLLPAGTDTVPHQEDLFRLVAVPPLAPRREDPPDLPAGVESALQAYIPGAILHRLTAGQGDWLAEIRRVTVIFANLPDFSTATPIETGQAVMEALQRVLYRYEGSVNKVSVDDKGVVLVGALGLHPFAHEDDPARGVLAAMDMVRELKDMGVRVSIGVTTGPAFCGVIGNEVRREYTMIGEVMNRAARLMSAAVQVAPEWPVLADHATREQARGRAAFREIESLQLKGIREQVAAFQPTGIESTGERARGSLIGRNEERLQIGEHLQKLVHGESSTLILEGDAGIGKSRLVEEARQQAERLSIRHFTASGDAVEKSTPYFAWRAVFTDLLGIDLAVDATTNTTGVLSKLKSLWKVIDRAPLLNPVLPFSIPDNELTEQMTGQVRADNTRQLMVEVLRDGLKNHPALLIVEDAHWLDSASWALLRAVQQEIDPLFLFIATRPMDGENPPEYEDLQAQPDTHFLTLEALPSGSVEELLQQRLGVSRIDPEIVRYVQARAEGHPFFSEEIAYALRESGLIRVENGAAMLREGVTDLDLVDFPQTIQGVITSRIDQLSPQQQFTLKVASVIGRIFTHGILHSIHPIPEDRPALRRILDTLDRLDVTPLERPEPELSYIFKHIITQEVAYNMMSFAQRRQLHQVLAEYYEELYREDLSDQYPLLAYHWEQAGVWEKAAEYQYLAGVQALRGFANEEAIHHFTALLETAAKIPDAFSTEDHIRWHRLLGVAYQASGLFKESTDHLEEAARLLGAPIPYQRSELFPRIALGILKQAFKRTWRRPLPEVTGAEEGSSRAVEMARIYDELAFVYFLSDDVARMVFVDLEMLNVADQIGVRQELARTLSTVAVVAGLGGLHSVADAFDRLAQEAADRLQHIPTTVRVKLARAVYAIGQGRWEEVEELVTDAQRMSEEIGDRRQYGEATVILAMNSLLRGDIADGYAQYKQLETHANKISNPIQQVWAIDGQVIALLICDQCDQASEPIRQAGAIAFENVDHASIIYNNGYAAYTFLQTGDPMKAIEHLDTALEHLQRSLPLVYSMVYSLNWIAETAIRLWESDPDRTSQQRARQALRFNRAFARSFPIGRPGLVRNQGLMDHVAGRPVRAARAWKRSLEEAQKLRLPYDELLAHRLLAAHGPEAQRAAHAQKAARLQYRLCGDEG